MEVGGGRISIGYLFIYSISMGETLCVSAKLRVISADFADFQTKNPLIRKADRQNI
jgi:hypothetical protein